MDFQPVGTNALTTPEFEGIHECPSDDLGLSRMTGFQGEHALTGEDDSLERPHLNEASTDSYKCLFTVDLRLSI